MANNLPIGVFDSGVGGLTVLKELLINFENERFIYFGDTARVPYGDKSPETILRYSLENTVFLLEKEIKILVVACNTASVYAVEKLTQWLKIPVVGVIEPSARAAAFATKNKKIAVLATKSTIKSKAYPKAIKGYLEEAEILSIACPLLVPFAEEKMFDHPSLKGLLEEYLEPVKSQGFDTVLLGCTHYPMLKNTIKKTLPESTTVIDSAFSVAQNVEELMVNFGLKSQKLLNGEPAQFYVSDDPTRFQEIGQLFLERRLEKVEKADFELKKALIY